MKNIIIGVLLVVLIVGAVMVNYNYNEIKEVRNSALDSVTSLSTHLMMKDLEIERLEGVKECTK